MNRKVFNFQGKDFEVVSLLDANKRRWYAANVFAEICGYAAPNKTIASQVRKENSKNFEDLRNDETKGLQPKTKFINSNGVLDLLRFAKIPNVEQIFSFIRDDILQNYGDTLPEPLPLISKGICFDGKINVDLIAVKKRNENWFLAKPFTKALEFANHQSAIEKNVDKTCKTTFEEIVEDNIAICIKSTIHTPTTIQEVGIGSPQTGSLLIHNTPTSTTVDLHQSSWYPGTDPTLKNAQSKRVQTMGERRSPAANHRRGQLRSGQRRHV
jgi:prophage antirepressor-like protein